MAPPFTDAKSTVRPAFSKIRKGSNASEAQLPVGVVPSRRAVAELLQMRAFGMMLSVFLLVRNMAHS